MTRLVVDSNQLRSEELRAFLAKSRSNVAVLTDYSAIEAYKGSDLNGIYLSMSVLSNFPNQVVILKSTNEVCGLSGKGSGLQKRLIDFDQTRKFGNFVRYLRAAQAGDLGLQRRILDLGDSAANHMARIYKDAREVADGIPGIAGHLSKEERQWIREGSPFSPELVKKTVANVMELSAFMFSQHPKVASLPNYNELFNTFIFRYSLCCYLLALDWAAVGGAVDAKPERHQNDLIDMSFASYATYFDGLLTKDRKCMDIYRKAERWLTGVLRR